jgi:hypothetical protein
MTTLLTVMEIEMIFPSGPHCNENPIYVFLFCELRSLNPNFHIHVSVRDLYIHRIGPHTYFLAEE